MKILLYTGYQKEKWDGNTTSGLAGSEIAVIKLAEELVNFGYNVVVSGDVAHSGKIRGVDYCHLSKIHEDHFDTFDIIVGTSYIHFVLEFKEYNFKYFEIKASDPPAKTPHSTMSPSIDL